MTNSERIERIKKGPRKGQSKRSLQSDLKLAKAQLQKPHNFMGGVMWSCIVASYEKALGLPVTPKAYDQHADGSNRRDYDFTTVKVDPKTGVFSLEMKK